MENLCYDHVKNVKVTIFVLVSATRRRRKSRTDGDVGMDTSDATASKTQVTEER